VRAFKSACFLNRPKLWALGNHLRKSAIIYVVVKWAGHRKGWEDSDGRQGRKGEREGRKKGRNVQEQMGINGRE
jgi:hypothetical protein